MSDDEHHNEHLLKNTVDEERAKVSNMVCKLGSKLSSLMITCGFLVFAFGIYLLAMPPDPAISPSVAIIFTCSLGFVGGLNVLCGLLLLLGEQ